MFQAMELDPEFSKKIGQLVILGGAFSVNGNANPAAEANVCCHNPRGIVTSFHLIWTCVEIPFYDLLFLTTDTISLTFKTCQ